MNSTILPVSKLSRALRKELAIPPTISEDANVEVFIKILNVSKTDEKEWNNKDFQTLREENLEFWKSEDDDNIFAPL